MSKYIKRSFTIIPNNFNEDGRVLRLSFEQRIIFLECILKSDDLGLMKIDAFELAHHIGSTEAKVNKALDMITTKLRLAYRYPSKDGEILLLPKHLKYQITPKKRKWDLQCPLPKWDELPAETQKAFPELENALPKLWSVLPKKGSVLPPVYVYVDVAVPSDVSVSIVPTESAKRRLSEPSGPDILPLTQEPSPGVRTHDGSEAKCLAMNLIKKFKRKERRVVIEYIAHCLTPHNRGPFLEHGTLRDTTYLLSILNELLLLADGKSIGKYKWQEVPVVDHQTLIETMARATRVSNTRFETNNFLKSCLQNNSRDKLHDIYGEE